MIRFILPMLALTLLAGCGQRAGQPVSQEGEAASTEMQQQQKEEKAPVGSSEEPKSEAESKTATQGGAEESSEPPQANQATDFVKNLNVGAAAQLLQEQSDITVLDVRTPKEYNNGHIKGAKNLDFHSDRFKQQLTSLDKDEPYLVHCASGGRSSQAREMMDKLGFKKIYHLEGGMNAWQKAGKPVVE